MHSTEESDKSLFQTSFFDLLSTITILEDFFTIFDQSSSMLMLNSRINLNLWKAEKRNKIPQGRTTFQPFRLPGAFLANRQTFPSSSSSSSFSSYLLAFDYNFPTIRTTYLPSVWSPFQTIRHFQACIPYPSLFLKKQGQDQGQGSPFEF